MFQYHLLVIPLKGAALHPVSSSAHKYNIFGNGIWKQRFLTPFKNAGWEYKDIGFEGKQDKNCDMCSLGTMVLYRNSECTKGKFNDIGREVLT